MNMKFVNILLSICWIIIGAVCFFFGFTTILSYINPNIHHIIVIDISYPISNILIGIITTTIGIKLFIPNQKVSRMLYLFVPYSIAIVLSCGFSSLIRNPTVIDIRSLLCKLFMGMVMPSFSLFIGIISYLTIKYLKKTNKIDSRLSFKTVFKGSIKRNIIELLLLFIIPIFFQKFIHYHMIGRLFY